MSKARRCANRLYTGHVDVKNLTTREFALIQDGLAALLAALPTRHALRPEVADLIESLKES
jgi:hypothetical protein